MYRKFSIVLSIVIFTSCMTQNITKNYNGFNQYKAGENYYYYFDNSESQSLLIYIDGSGLTSVLGVSEENRFVSYSFANPLAEYFCKTESILIPEKPGMSFGEVYHTDLDVVKMYTVDNLVEAYAKSIDLHLSENNYENICIIGVSEGGLLVPKIYSELSNKTEIGELIILGAGGLSQYDCFKIQYDNYLKLPSDYRKQLAILEEVKEEITENPHSITDGYLGLPYSRWSSFFEYKPLEYISKITIPILYIQGKEDTNSPIESVEAVEKLALNNIYFKYIDTMGHMPGNNRQLKDVLGIIEQWRSEN